MATGLGAGADWAMTQSLQLLGSGRGAPREHSRAGGFAMTAHLHRDSHTGRLCGFEYQMRPALSLTDSMNTLLSLFELDVQDETRRHCDLTYKFSGYKFLHDFAITENYYVLVRPCAADDLHV